MEEWGRRGGSRDRWRKEAFKHWDRGLETQGPGCINCTLSISPAAAASISICGILFKSALDN